MLHVRPHLALAAPAFLVRDETLADVARREALLDAAFGPARFAKTCERLREGRRPADGLALTAEDATGRLVGTVRLWHVDLGSAGAGLMLGPIAVAAEARSLGVGAALMRAAVARAARLGHRAIVLVGDAPWYARFGFSPSTRPPTTRWSPRFAYSARTVPPSGDHLWTR